MKRLILAVAMVALMATTLYAEPAPRGWSGTVTSDSYAVNLAVMQSSGLLTAATKVTIRTSVACTVTFTRRAGTVYYSGDLSMESTDDAGVQEAVPLLADKDYFFDTNAQGLLFTGANTATVAVRVEY